MAAIRLDTRTPKSLRVCGAWRRHLSDRRRTRPGERMGLEQGYDLLRANKMTVGLFRRSLRFRNSGYGFGIRGAEDFQGAQSGGAAGFDGEFAEDLQEMLFDGR